jgi:hypothetical protein
MPIVAPRFGSTVSPITEKSALNDLEYILKKITVNPEYSLARVNANGGPSPWDTR